MRQLGGVSLFCVLAATIPLPAHAQCSNNNIGAAQLNASGGVATPPISDGSWNPTGGSYTYSFQGTKVYVVNNNNMAQKWATAAVNDSPATIQGVPIPVQLMNNGTKTTVFMSSSDGYVKRFDFNGSSLSQVCATPTPLTLAGGDTLTASPTVMIHAYSSNPSFIALNKDVVYVPTNYASSYIGNQVVAINAADCSILWRFNNKGNYPMDYASDGCSLDYGDAMNSPTLYCGTHLPYLHPQGTLWAIDAVAGTLKWATNADSITSRPELRNGRLYVATQAGSIRAHSSTDGTLFWSASIASSITKDLYAEQRFSGGMNSQIIVTDPLGTVHALTDNGASYGFTWTYTPSGGAHAISSPTVSNIDGKVYVGTNTGQLHQLNLLTGAFEHGVTAGASGTDSVYDPTLDVSSQAATNLDRLRVSTSSGGVSASNLKSFCIPWLADAAQAGADVPVHEPGWGPEPAPNRAPGSPGAPHPAVACPGSAPTGACVNYTCDATTGTWQPHVLANGTACSDGNAHTCDAMTCDCGTFGCIFGTCGSTCVADPNDHCQSGVCVSNYTDSHLGWICTATDTTNVCGSNTHCACNYFCGSVGQTDVCQDSKACCGGNKCIDLMNDPLNCGACGHDCAKQRFGPYTPEGVDICQQGVCVRNPGYYCSPQAPDESVLNSKASQLTGASNINFPTLQISFPTTCGIGISFAGRPNDGGCFLGGPGYNNGIALIDPTNSNNVQRFQPISCNGFCFGGTCPPPPYTTPFTSMSLLWDGFTGDIQSKSDWVLVGTESFQNGSNGSTNPLPGAFVVLDEKVVSGGNIFTYNVAGGTVQTSSTPFFDLQYNQGVVGPAIPDSQSPFDTNGMNMYFGNWNAGWNAAWDGYVTIVNVKCTGQGGNPPPSCTFTASTPPNWPPSGWPGTHITTMTYSDYECRGGTTGTCSAFEPNPTKIFLTTGKQVWVWYPPYLSGSPVNSGGLFADISNPALYTPDPTNPAEQAIIGFTSAAPDPLYGDLYLEGRDVAGNLEDFVLYVPNTYTTVAYAPKAFYNLGDMAKSLHLTGRQNGTSFSVPYNYTTTTPEGRLAAVNANCIRMTVQEGANPTFANLPLWP
jgi:hypothetical protein